MSVEISAQVAENVVAELVHRLVAEHRLGEPDATVLKPILPASGGFRAKDQKADDPGQAKSEQAGDDAAEDRLPIGIAHLRQPFRAEIDLRLLHRRDLVADRIHVLLAAIALHDCERGGLSLALAQIDRLFEFAELGVDVLFQRCEAVLLRGIVDRQAPQHIEPRPNILRRRVVRAEVAIFIGQQIAALARFGVSSPWKAHRPMRSTCHRCG